MNDSRLIARVMLEQDETSLWELWVRYRTNCGDTDLFEFEAYLYGAHELPPVDLVVLSCAIKEVKAPMGGSGHGR